VDQSSLRVTATIPNVPGASTLRGIAVQTNFNSPPNIAWVAGTEANVVTLVNLDTATIATGIPVNRPVAVAFSGADSIMNIASAGDNRVISFHAPSLTVRSLAEGISTPQDISDTSFGLVATMGPTNTLAWINSAGQVSYTSGLPGAAGLTYA